MSPSETREVNVRTVADILGHANPAVSLGRYAHVLPNVRRRAARPFGGYWS
jgi:hypothetical protein